MTWPYSLPGHAGLKLVTVHQRDDTPYAYTRKEVHNLPGRHGSYEKDLEEIYERAGAIDNIQLGYLREVSQQKKYLPQAFRTCRGIMSLEGKYGLARLVAACACASEGRLCGNRQEFPCNGRGLPCMQERYKDSVFQYIEASQFAQGGKGQEYDRD